MAKQGKRVKKAKKVNGVSDLLSGLEDAYEEAEEIESSFDPIPDGKYSALILTAPQIGKSKSSDRIQVKWELEINSGEYEGRREWKYDGLTDKLGNPNEKSIGFIKGTVAKLGISVPGKISGLQKALNQAMDMEVSITIKTQPLSESQKAEGLEPFRNIYINGLIEDDEGDDGL